MWYVLQAAFIIIIYNYIMGVRSKLKVINSKRLRVTEIDVKTANLLLIVLRDVNDCIICNIQSFTEHTPEGLFS